MTVRTGNAYVEEMIADEDIDVEDFCRVSCDRHVRRASVETYDCIALTQARAGETTILMVLGRQDRSA